VYVYSIKYLCDHHLLANSLISFAIKALH